MTLPDNGDKKTVTQLNVNQTFEIIEKNMFNQKDPDFKMIQNHKVFYGKCSYMISATWNEFIENSDYYLNEAIDRRENIGDYEIHDTVETSD